MEKNRTYADVVRNIWDNSELWSSVQKSKMNKEEQKSVCNLLLPEDSLTVKLRPPVLIADSSSPDNTSATSNTEEPRE